VGSNLERVGFVSRSRYAFRPADDLGREFSDRLGWMRSLCEFLSDLALIVVFEVWVMIGWLKKWYAALWLWKNYKGRYCLRHREKYSLGFGYCPVCVEIRSRKRALSKIKRSSKELKMNKWVNG